MVSPITQLVVVDDYVYDENQSVEHVVLLNNDGTTYGGSTSSVDGKALHIVSQSMIDEIADYIEQGFVMPEGTEYWPAPSYAETESGEYTLDYRGFDKVFIESWPVKTVSETWKASQVATSSPRYIKNSYGIWYRADTGGTTGATEPDWGSLSVSDLLAQKTIVDGTSSWYFQGKKIPASVKIMCDRKVAIYNWVDFFQPNIGRSSIFNQLWLNAIMLPIVSGSFGNVRTIYDPLGTNLSRIIPPNNGYLAGGVVFLNGGYEPNYEEWRSDLDGMPIIPA